jgi:hypothetical protein
MRGTMRVDRESQDADASPPIESALESDQSLSRKMAERYLGEVRRRPRRKVDPSMEAQVEEISEEEKPG